MIIYIVSKTDTINDYLYSSPPQVNNLQLYESVVKWYRFNYFTSQFKLIS